MANSDLRQQILISLRAEGLGEADKAREEVARLKEEILRLSKAFGEGRMEAAPFKAEVTALGGQLAFFNGIVKETESGLKAIDVGLHTLQMTAIKFADAYEASMARAAEAGAALELKEAERLARVATAHEQYLAREATAAAAAELTEAERLARVATAHEANAAREQAAGDAAALAEADRLARVAVAHEQYLARAATADAEAELKEAERLARVATAHEAAEARERAAGDATALREADRLARVAVQHDQHLDRQAAADAAAELTEAERLARIAATHEQYLEREAAAERRTTAEIASARASLNMQRRDALDAAQVEIQRQALQTQRVITGIGTAADHSHDKANKFGYGILNVAHAFQDLQYGMGAVLNNIPLVMTSLGFGAGVAGAVMAAGVAVEMLRGQVGSLGAALGWANDPAKRLGDTIAEVQAKISAISGKTFKFAVDYQDLHEAERRLERLQKLKALVEGTRETDAEKTMSQVVQGIVTGKAGGSDAIEKAVAEIEATRGREHGSQLDVNVVANANRQIEAIRKMPVNSVIPGHFGQSGWAVILELERRRDAAQENINAARHGFVQEESGKFLAGDPDAIARMKGRVRDFPGAFTPEGGAAITSMPNSAAEMQLAAERKVGLDQAAAIDADNVKATKEWQALQAKNAREKKAKAKAKAVADKAAATAHQQEVARQANLFGHEFDDEKGPGSLDAAIVGRAGQGQTKEQIQGALAPSMAQRLAGKVPADLVGEVADAIVTKAIDAVRAEVAAAGGGPGGVRAVAGARAQKLGRAADAEAKRAGREDVGEYEQGLADQIEFNAGGMLNRQGALTAAHRAVQDIRQGRNEYDAAWDALNHTVAELARETAAFRRQGADHAGQARRNQPQRPSPLPQFGR